MNVRQLTPRQSAVIADLFEGGLDAAASERMGVYDGGRGKILDAGGRNAPLFFCKLMLANR